MAPLIVGTRVFSGRPRHGVERQHLGLDDAIEPEMAAFAGRELEGVYARLVAVHQHALDAHVAFALDEIAIDVRDAQRLLLEPGALDRGAHGLLARERRDAVE